MSLARRLALLQWARDANAFILEDDYDSEFRYACAPTPALKALDGNQGRVIYVGTLSKLLAPGLRLGFLVAPEAVVEVLRSVRNGSGHRVPLSLQATAAEFIGNGHLGSHIRRSQAVYAQRRIALLEAIHSAGSERMSVASNATGLHLLADLPDALDDRAIASAAHARNIGVAALSEFFVAARGRTRRGLLMGFGNTRAESMQGAVETLCRLIDRQRGQTT